MKCLVTDFGGTAVKYCLMDENANSSDHGEVPAPTACAEDLVNLMKDLYAQFADRIEGIAMSFPGMVDSDTGDLPGGGAYYYLWGGNVLDLLRPHLPVPISIENDGKCGALSEVWKGNLRDVNDGAVIIIGTGVAGGLIKDKRIHKGNLATAGELSYLLVRPGEYNMSNSMSAEAAMMGLIPKVRAAKGIAAELSEPEKKAAEVGQISDAPIEADPNVEQVKVDGKQIMKWVHEGDPAVLPIYQKFIEHIALMIHNVHVVFAPDKIAIGGGITRDPRVIPDIRAELDKLYEGISVIASAPTAKLVPCAFLGEANQAGAMYNYLLHFHPELIA